jgi:NADPH-dependent ferric siderophore reductase|nr:siderophore-interacting protein [Gilliamella apicola]
MLERPRRVIVNALLTVLKVKRISDSFIRVQFSCDKRLTIDPLWICPHLKLLFADPSTGTIMFPQLDENNKIVVNDKIRQLVRSYSIRYFDEVTNQLSIDFAIHSEGLATRWAQEAKVGNQIGIVSIVGKLNFNNETLVLMGDISAVPTICYTLEHLPHNYIAYAFIEVNHQTDIIPLSIHEKVKINWFIRDYNKPNQLVDKVINDSEIVNHNNLLFWGGMESSLAQQLRQALKDKYVDLPPNAIHVISYWREGFAEGEFKHRE